MTSRAESDDQHAITIAHRFQQGHRLEHGDVAVLAKAVLRHAGGEGVPQALLTAAPEDRTMRVGVIGHVDDQPSDGICDDSYDGPTTAAKAQQTAMVRLPSGEPAVVKAGQVPPAGARKVAP